MLIRDAQTGDQLENVQAHEFDLQINDIQFSPDRTYFLTASKDKSAKVGKRQADTQPRN